jgi:hypothetical protein
MKKNTWTVSQNFNDTEMNYPRIFLEKNGMIYREFDSLQAADRMLKEKLAQENQTAVSWIGLN